MEPVPVPTKAVSGPPSKPNEPSNVTGKMIAKGLAGSPAGWSHVAGPWKFNCPWFVFLIEVSIRLRKKDVPPECVPGEQIPHTPGPAASWIRKEGSPGVTDPEPFPWFPIVTETLIMSAIAEVDRTRKNRRMAMGIAKSLRRPSRLLNL